MKSLYLLLAVFWCCLASSLAFFTGDSIYLAWGIFLPPSLLLINMARPRRGLHYVYWNRYIYVFGGLVLGMLAMPFIIAYLGLKFRISVETIMILWAAWFVGFIPGFFLWFKFYFMPAWGDWRVGRRYPRMAAAARRLKKFLEHYTWYIPLIFVQGKPYIVVGYEVQGLTGIATLDEQGRFVKDETLVDTLMRCYKLAVAVLHMPDSLARAKEIDSFKQTDRQMQGAFLRLRVNEEYFLAAGKPLHDLWKSICGFEQDVHTIFTTVVERKMWQTQWALEHGLHRLTEVSDEQLREAEARLAEFDTVLLDHRARIEQVAANAEALLKALADPTVTGNGKSIRLKHRAVVEELLKSLIVMGQASAVWKSTVIDFLPREEEWKVWRERKAMAEKLEQERTI